ncbi:thiamine pyrophosphate-dependent dehydrogenase E1 component subunit alpha [Pseudoteredinibacter isoporae]|uniref:thiamine pyrophosphate-dependent dehydrogenase E1 component subunit alpha n=1 Tax=Pseudoteredinibacter isoporae TaxID=570281 RepID=UPI003108FF93
MSSASDEKPNLMHQTRFIQGHDLPIPTLSILNADGSIQAGAEVPELDQETAIKIYRNMVYIRVLDERMISAQRQGRLSFYLTCSGEEAAVTGTAAAFTMNDMIMGQYREQAALRLRGFSTEQFMNQLLSNKDDLGKGRQMPVHYGSNELNYMTISSPLGTQIPQAAGYAYAQKLQGNDACTLCYFGEGAASEGDFHAGMNMAAVLNCPVVFVCRNNGYAISTPADEQFKGDGIAARGVGYGIKTIRVDGNDILAVYSASLVARRIAIENNEPVLIETMSYRLGAHSTSDDPSGYRSKDEEDKWREKDPIERMQNWLQSKGWWDEDEEKTILESYRKEVLDTLKRVEKKDMPGLDELISDVYDTPPVHLQKQFDELKEHIAKYPENYPVAGGAKHG